MQPEADYGRLPNGDWKTVARAGEDAEVQEVKKGVELVGRRYRGPFDALGPGGDVDHRVIGWDEVALDEGTGVVHIAPGCGSEDPCRQARRPPRAQAPRFRSRELLGPTKTGGFSS